MLWVSYLLSETLGHYRYCYVAFLGIWVIDALDLTRPKPVEGEYGCAPIRAVVFRYTSNILGHGRSLFAPFAVSIRVLFFLIQA
jgi:lipopolysaccharide export LptBFGC system permease protein LptF